MMTSTLASPGLACCDHFPCVTPLQDFRGPTGIVIVPSSLVDDYCRQLTTVVRHMVIMGIHPSPERIQLATDTVVELRFSQKSAGCNKQTFATIAAVIIVTCIIVQLFVMPSPRHAYNVSGNQMSHSARVLELSATTENRSASSPTLKAERERLCAYKVHVYMDESPHAVESSYVSRIILGGIRAACGACFIIHPRASFVKDVEFRALDAVFLLAMGHPSEAEESVMRANASWARARVVVHALSDETEDYPMSSYSLPRVVLRNYMSSKEGRASDLTYLERNEADLGREPAASRVLWVPLGYTDSFLPQLIPEGYLPVRDRPLIWSWSGNKGSTLRRNFVSSMHDDGVAQLIKHGKFFTYEGFMGESRLGAWAYSRLLYESQLAPCPDGNSPDQFRIYEAMEAGAVPIVSRGHEQLSFLDRLGFRSLHADDWRDAARSVLLPLVLNLSQPVGSEARDTLLEQLQSAQTANAAALARMHKRVQRRVGAELCAAAGAPLCRDCDVPLPFEPVASISASNGVGLY